MDPLHIIWPHRWEHDKNPTNLHDCLKHLLCRNTEFVISIVGYSGSDYPKIFDDIKDLLGSKLKTFGYLAKNDYIDLLKDGDIVLSTSDHEFFGYSVLEAVMHGCYPIVPKRLSYVEMYPEECLYNTYNQLHKKLIAYCNKPKTLRNKPKIDISRFYWKNMHSDYSIFLNINLLLN